MQNSLSKPSPLEKNCRQEMIKTNLEKEIKKKQLLMKKDGTGSCAFIHCEEEFAYPTGDCHCREPPSKSRPGYPWTKKKCKVFYSCPGFTWMYSIVALKKKKTFSAGAVKLCSVQSVLYYKHPLLSWSCYPSHSPGGPEELEASIAGLEEGRKRE